ncbi:MAG: Ig-like domain-containing protein [Clostridiales bacterium]|nr:Ig-like domain-containing protein [Clostridiales bacterium]
MARSVIPPDAEDKSVDWTSSDKDFATVDKNGLVKFNGAGEVTLTAHLKNGVSRDLLLKIVEEDPAIPDSIVPQEAEINLNAGDQYPILVSTEPEPAGLNNFEYESDNESVATVDQYGVVTATGDGTATITVSANSVDAPYDTPPLTATVKVKVSSKLMLGDDASDDAPVLAGRKKKKI